MGWFNSLSKSVGRIGKSISSTLKVGEKHPMKMIAMIGHKAASSLHSIDTSARLVTAPLTRASGIDVYDFTPAGVVTSLGADVLDESASGLDLADKAAHGQKVTNKELNNLGGRVVNSGVEYGIHRVSGVLGGKAGSKVAKKLGSKALGNLAGKVASQRIVKQMANGNH
jgi:hypothetical protein